MLVRLGITSVRHVSCGTKPVLLGADALYLSIRRSGAGEPYHRVVPALPIKADFGGEAAISLDFGELRFGQTWSKIDVAAGGQHRQRERNAADHCNVPTNRSNR